MAKKKPKKTTSQSSSVTTPSVVQNMNQSPPSVVSQLSPSILSSAQVQQAQNSALQNNLATAQGINPPPGGSVSASGAIANQFSSPTPETEQYDRWAVDNYNPYQFNNQMQADEYAYGNPESNLSRTIATDRANFDSPYVSQYIPGGTYTGSDLSSTSAPYRLPPQYQKPLEIKTTTSGMNSASGTVRAGQGFAPVSGVAKPVVKYDDYQVLKNLNGTDTATDGIQSSGGSIRGAFSKAATTAVSTSKAAGMPLTVGQITTSMNGLLGQLTGAMVEPGKGIPFINRATGRDLIEEATIAAINGANPRVTKEQKEFLKSIYEINKQTGNLELKSDMQTAWNNLKAASITSKASIAMPYEGGMMPISVPADSAVSHLFDLRDKIIKIVAGDKGSPEYKKIFDESTISPSFSTSTTGGNQILPRSRAMAVDELPGTLAVFAKFGLNDLSSFVPR